MEEEKKYYQPEEKRYYEVNLKPFPVNKLPDKTRKFVESVSASVQVAPDMVATPLLATFAAALQSRFAVRIDSTYVEPLCLYTMTIARPSERKSAIISLLEKPLWEYQQKTNEAVDLAREKGVEDVTYTTLYVTDATPEKLAKLMKENNGAIALLSDEPDALAVAAGLRYGKSRNLGLMLQAWSAGRVMIQRATEDKRISIDRAVMSVAVMSQPSFVEELIKDKEMSNRGFMQRFLYSKPLSQVGSRTFNKPEIPKEVLDWYYNLMKNFLDFTVDPIFELTLTDWAKKQAGVFFEILETQIGTRPELEGWMGKAFGQTMRIAGILHCVRWEDAEEAWKNPIDEKDVAAATGIMDYYISHAKAVFTDIDVSEEIKDSRDLYRRMLESGQETFTKTDLFTLTSRKIPKTRLEAALTKLIQGQYIMIANPEDGEKNYRYALIGAIREAHEESPYR